MKQIIIGLAGHIDHGKTALVQALTGVNTDRLKDEIRRGMTIDLGFAFLSEQITLIDVPGHEKFVKNMMSGVSSVDAALLVVAADDGVMPQTREHLDILSLLGVKTGCIVLNKVDLADEDWLMLIESDIHELVKETFLQNAPVVHTSAVKNIGIQELSATILELKSRINEKSDYGFFRQNVDRVFSIKGFGTVTTGTVSSGRLSIGDTVEMLPQGKLVKVRGLQSHHRPVNTVELGDRAAINLTNVEIGREDLSRGNVLAEPGYFQPTTQIGATLKLLSRTQKPVRQNQRVRIHLGTQEVMARIFIIDKSSLKPGEESPVIYALETPLIAGWGDKYIIRTYSPTDTIGGGEILLNMINDKLKTASNLVKNLFYGTYEDRLVKMIQSWGARPLNETRAKLVFSRSPQWLDSKVNLDDRINWIQYKTDRWLVASSTVAALEEQINNELQKFLSNNSYRLGLQKEEIRQKTKADIRFLEFILDSMVNSGMLSHEGEIYYPPGHAIKLSSSENELLEKLLTLLDEEKFSSSKLSELADQLQEPEKRIKLLMDIAEQQGKILRVEGYLMFTRRNFENLKSKLHSFFDHQDLLSVGDFKELAETSRKYAMPLLEYFDQQKITYRTAGGRKRIP